MGIPLIKYNLYIFCFLQPKNFADKGKNNSHPDDLALLFHTIFDYTLTISVEIFFTWLAT